MTDAAVCSSALPVAARPLRRDAERNRQRILEAAQQVFAEQGLRASLDDVARRAEVGVGTVYRRFPDKEALVEALFEIRVGQIIDIAEQATSMASGWNGLVHFLSEVSAVQAGDRGLREIALSAGFGKSRVAALRSRVASAVDQLVTRAQAEGALRPGITGNDIPLLLLMVGEVAQNAQGFRPDLGRRYLRLILDGLRNGPGTTDLGDPVDDNELEQFMKGWGPLPR
jgi:AcrR family transcriptional regulator